MVHVFLPNVFDSKIIDDQRECNRLCFVFPEAGGIVASIVSVGEQSFFAEACLPGYLLVGAPIRLVAFPGKCIHFLRVQVNCIV